MGWQVWRWEYVWWFHFAREAVPDRWCSIRKRSLTQSVHAHRGKTTEPHWSCMADLAVADMTAHKSTTLHSPWTCKSHQRNRLYWLWAHWSAADVSNHTQYSITIHQNWPHWSHTTTAWTAQKSKRKSFLGRLNSSWKQKSNNKTQINGRPCWQERTKEQIINSLSTSSRKMAGLFPPSSSVVLFRLLSPAAFRISCPTCQQSLSLSTVPPAPPGNTVTAMISCSTCQHSHCHDQLSYLSTQSLSWSAVLLVNTVNNQLSHLLTQSLSWSDVLPVNTVTVMISCPTC